MPLLFTWSEFWQQVVDGLASGGIYASLALAIVLVYRSTRVINFAQGEMAMFTTFIAWTLLHHGFSYWPAFVLTLLIAFAGGVAIEEALIRPVRNRPPLTTIIVTLGLFVALNGAANWEWGGDVKDFPSPFSTRPVHLGGVAFSIHDLGIIGVSLGLVALLWLFFRFTKLGLALRAAAVNPDESRLVGVRVPWMLALGWGIAAMLGAVSGLMVAPIVFLEPNMMQGVLLYAFAAAVLGGLDSPLGAVVGGLLLGVTLNLLGTYVNFIGSELQLAVGLAIILGVLLIRPAGLFGREAIWRV
jgi:branched-chain amino acid transport system permease protein